MVVQKTTLVLHFSYRSVSGVFFLVDFSPYFLMCWCTIFVFINFYRCFFINPSVRPVQVLSKPSLISLKRLVVVRMKSAAWKYCASYGFVVWSITLFNTFFYCCVSRLTSHIPDCLLLVPFIVCFPFFLTEVSCWSSEMVNPSSHKTPNDISGDVIIFGQM